jgi:hypothetical protein
MTLRWDLTVTAGEGCEGRPSTTSLLRHEAVDGRDKHGHDE